MRAAVIREHGSYQQIQYEERPSPKPAELQYLIRVKACGLNHLDTWVRRGVPGHKFPLPLVPGSDITGIIEAVGPLAKRFKVGDRVIVNPSLFCGSCNFCQSGQDHLCQKWGLMGETADGGCQEQIVVDESRVYALPTQVTFEQGACLPIAYVTAWEMLVGKAHAHQGETILIHAAGSGVSVAAIQIAKLLGLQIIVTSSSEAKLQRAKSLGAHRFIDLSKEGFREAVKNLTGKAGVDIVVDHVGEATFMDSIRSLRKGGRLVSCGATSGANLQIDWKHVFFKNLSLIGSTYGPRSAFIDVLKRFETKQIVPVLDSFIKFEELAKGHEALETRQVFGKVVMNFERTGT